VELVEFGPVSLRQWMELTDRDPQAFGAVGAALAWRPKDRHVGLQTADGRLVAVAGATIATVEVAGTGSFEVVGLGGLIIRKMVRGQGLMPTLMDALSRMASGMGPGRAMIFCRTELAALYVGRGYTEITAPVWIDQPEGRIVMPMVSMWRPLRDGPAWPAGRVDVHGLPF
jgi:predicted GNAT family N-acyltransferase